MKAKRDKHLTILLTKEEHSLFKSLCSLRGTKISDCLRGFINEEIEAQKSRGSLPLEEASEDGSSRGATEYAEAGQSPQFRIQQLLSGSDTTAEIAFFCAKAFQEVIRGLKIDKALTEVDTDNAITIFKNILSGEFTKTAKFGGPPEKIHLNEVDRIYLNALVNLNWNLLDSIFQIWKNIVYKRVGPDEYRFGKFEFTEAFFNQQERSSRKLK